MRLGNCLTPHPPDRIGIEGRGRGRSGPILRLERSEHLEQGFGAFDGVFIGFVQPIELRCFPDSKRMEQQYHFSQIAALNFRRISLGTIEVPAFGPKAMAGARSGSAGAAFALLGRGATDVLDG